MDKLQKKDLNLNQMNYIGKGKTATCFVLDDLVYKFYYFSDRTKFLFLRQNMEEHLTNLSLIDGESFVKPISLIMNGDDVCGYVTSYKKACTLRELNPNRKLEDLIEASRRLYADLIKLSLFDFKLADVHDQNILFNDKFHIIDLDFGHFVNMNQKKLMNENMCVVNKTILKALFAVDLYWELYFKDDNLQRTYRNLVDYNDGDLTFLLYAIENLYDKENLTIEDLRKNKKVYGKKRKLLCNFR